MTPYLRQTLTTVYQISSLIFQGGIFAILCWSLWRSLRAEQEALERLREFRQQQQRTLDNLREGQR